MNDIDEAKKGFENLKKENPVVDYQESHTSGESPASSGGSKSGRSYSSSGGKKPSVEGERFDDYEKTPPQKPIEKKSTGQRFLDFVEKEKVARHNLKSIKHTPSVEPYERYSDVKIRQGQNIIVKLEDRAGNIESVQMKPEKLKDSLKTFDYRGRRVVGVSTIDNEVIYEAELSTDYAQRNMDYYRESYLKHGFMPYDTKEKIVSSTPDDFKRKDFIDEYVDIVYSKALNFDTSQKENEFLNRYKEAVFTREWAEKQTYTNPMTGETGTFKELKKSEPALYLVKNQEGWYVHLNRGRYMQNLDEQNKFNPLYWGGKAVSTIFSPEVLDVARESLFGDYRVDAQGRVHQDDIDKVLKQIKDPVGYHWKKQGDYYTKAQYEYSKLWDKKDIGGIGLRALSSPVSTVFVTSGLSFSLGMYSSSIHGSTKLLTLPKMLKGATITRSMAVDTAIGATFVGSAIHEVSTGNNEYTLNQKLQNFAIMTPSILGGAKIGYQKGTYRGATFDKTYKNMKSSFNDVYNRYMPQKVQDTFIKTKTNINKYDPWWGQRHTPTFVKTYFSRASSKSIQFKYNQFKFHRLHKRYVKDLKTYGKDLYPIAVKRGLVKDAGLAKQSELKIIPYSPADTIRYNIMPHSRPETETFYRDLKGGKKSFISIAKDKSGYSEGIIERINGEFSRVSGKSTYNVYTESEGFGALMPSKRTNYFSGVVKSKSIDIKHFDLTAQESIGSYHISPKVTTTKFGEPRSSGYSFGGRLFNENFSTRSVSITKNIEGSIPVADRYGFKRVDVPKMDYTITKGKITSGGIGEFSDKSLLIYPKEPSIKGFGSSGGGDFVGGGGSGSNIIGGGQIVKITPLSDFPTSNIFADAGSIGIFLRTGNMIKQQLGGGTSSATGSNMGQFVYADMKIVESGKGTNTIFKQQFVEPKMSGTNMKLNQSAFQDVKTVFRESTKNKNLFTPVSIHGYDTKLKWENITPSIMPSFSNNIKTDMGTSNIQSPMLFQGQSRFTSNESNMDMGNSNIMIPMLSFSQAQRRQSYSKSATRQVSISLLANVVTPPYYMKPLTSKIEPIIIDNADSYTKLPRLYFPDEKSKSKTKKKRKKKHDEFEIGYRIRRFKTPTISFDKEIKKINKMSRGIFK